MPFLLSDSQAQLQAHHHKMASDVLPITDAETNISDCDPATTDLPFPVRYRQQDELGFGSVKGQAACSYSLLLVFMCRVRP